MNVPMQGNCPPRQNLVGFNLGLLSEPELEAIAQHLSLCQRCEEILSDLHGGTEDSVVEQVKACLEAPPLLDEEAWAARGSRATVNETTDPFRPHHTGEPWIGRAVGPYVILGRIGRGGMGVVYKARQTLIDREVALKMILAGIHAGSEALARFRTEATAAARLKHPNVVHVYDFGEHDGLPYYSMELVEGGTLASQLAGGPLALREAADLVRTLAGAVEEAHQHQVLHRDLKPGNILLTIDGAPKVADFGLAKLLDAEGLVHTVSGGAMGTPSYMAPEQTGNRSAEIGPATDVYGLGAILYAALTGGPPFRAPRRELLLTQVQFEEPLPPSRLRPGVPAALDHICLKCLEKAPAQRYPSAQSLADDLGRWLRDEHPLGRRNWLQRLARPVRRWAARVRRRWAVIGLTLLIVALVGRAMYLGVRSDPVVEDPLAPLLRELEEGRPVTLIGQQGGPEWSASLTEGVAGKANTGGDGCFVLESWPLGLLELLPDPQHSSYTLSAQVRHLRGDALGSDVGVYVARQTYLRERGNVYFFTRLEFNDIHRLNSANMKADPKVPEAIKQKLSAKPKPHVVQLYPHLYSDEHWKPSISRKVSGASGPRFGPAGEPHTKWHDLELTVTPEKLVARWDGKAFSLPVMDIQQGIQKDVLELRKFHLHRNDPDVQRLWPTFDPRGGVGLFVHRGSASFRAVTLTPIVEAR